MKVIHIDASEGIQDAFTDWLEEVDAEEISILSPEVEVNHKTEQDGYKFNGSYMEPELVTKSNVERKKDHGYKIDGCFYKPHYVQVMNSDESEFLECHYNMINLKTKEIDIRLECMSDMEEFKADLHRVFKEINKIQGMKHV